MTVSAPKSMEVMKTPLLTRTVRLVTGPACAGPPTLLVKSVNARSKLPSTGPLASFSCPW